MKRTLPALLFLLLIFGFSCTLRAQLERFEDVESIGKKGFFKNYVSGFFRGFKDYGNAFTMTGGLGVNMRSYNSFGIAPRQDPFFYSLNANLNIKVYSLNLPFSLMITAKNQDSSLPSFSEIRDAFANNLEAQKNRFVRLGISPRYKWMRLHLGHRSMSFSKFTLSNLVFFGGGAELTPGKWNVSFMGGRLAKAEPLNLSLVTPNLPVFQRYGGGAKIGYGDEDGSVSLIMFKAHDDPNSIAIPVESAQKVAPQENLTMGLNFQKLFLKHFRLRTEFGLSYVSPNKLDAPVASSALPGFLLQERNTTERNTAFDASLDYEAKKYTAGIQVRRIDPGYRTFGAYFFSNDLFDLVGNVRFTMLKDAVNVQLSAGVQSNNLELLDPTTTTRFVYSGDIGYAKDRFSGNLNYSNNTTDVGYILNEQLDSLNAVIVTQSSGLSLNYALKDGGSNQHIFALSGNLQTVGDDIENPLESTSSQLVTANFLYSYLLTDRKWRFSAKLLYNQNEVQQMLITRRGAGLGVTKSFLNNKISFGTDLDYYSNVSDGGGDGSNLSASLRSSYQLLKSLRANLRCGLLRTDNANIDPYSEVNVNFGVQYSFSMRPLTKLQKKLAAEKEKASLVEEAAKETKQNK